MPGVQILQLWALQAVQPGKRVKGASLTPSTDSTRLTSEPGYKVHFGRVISSHHEPLNFGTEASEPTVSCSSAALTCSRVLDRQSIGLIGLHLLQPFSSASSAERWFFIVQVEADASVLLHSAANAPGVFFDVAAFCSTCSCPL